MNAWNPKSVRLHAGIVVYDNMEKGSKVPAAVLDLDELQETGLARVRKINREAFCLPQHMLNLEAAQKKNLTRKFAKNLYFGDTISFDANNFNIKEGIISFERIRPFLETDMKDGIKKVKLMGIVNPNDPKHLYTEYFDKIEIPDEFVNDAIPNVCLNVWIALNYDFDSNTLVYKFHSYAGVCPVDEQLDIRSAPWNRGILQYNVMVLDDSDEDSGGIVLMDKGSSRNPDMELYKKQAFLTGDRSFYLREFPQYKCLTPIKSQQIPLNVGSLYSISCGWNIFEKFYMVTHIQRPNVEEQLPVHIEEDKSVKLKCIVKADENYRDFFSNKEFNYIYDPKGCLALLHLSKMKNNSIPVAIIDDGPSKCGQIRFRIDKVLGDKKKKLADFLNSEIVITRARGVVVGDDMILSAEHGPVNILFDIKSTPPAPGIFVIFDAIYSRDDNNFQVTKWQEDSEKKPLAVQERRMMEAHPNQKQLIFQVKVKTCNDKHLNKMFVCEEFGIIDDNFELVSLEKRNPRAALYTVWVKRSEVDAIECSPRSAFHVIAVGDEVPEDRVKDTDISKEDMELKRRFEERVRNLGTTENSAIRKSRFSVPSSAIPNQAPQRPRIAASTVSLLPSIPDEEGKIPEEDGIGHGVVVENLGTLDNPPKRKSRFSAPSSAKVNQAPQLPPSAFSRTSLLTSSPDMRIKSPGDNIGNDIDFVDTRIDSSFRRPTPELSGFLERQWTSVEKPNSSHRASPASFTSISRYSFQNESGMEQEGLSRMRLHDQPYDLRQSRDIPEYTGVVLAPSGSNAKYDIPETIARIRKHFPHNSTCGVGCTVNCRRLHEILKLMLKESGFWEEASRLYPALIHDLEISIKNSQRN